MAHLSSSFLMLNYTGTQTLRVQCLNNTSLERGEPPSTTPHLISKLQVTLIFCIGITYLFTSPESF